MKAVKVTFDLGILFATGKSNLSSGAKTSLAKFAEVLVQNPTMDIEVQGNTDNTGSLELNQTLSENRAKSVADYLILNSVPATQITKTVGLNYSNPVASNDTKEGRAQNRRVEIYLYASEEMIKQAEAQAN